MPLPTLRDLHLARQRTQGLIRRTPLVRSDSLSEANGAPVYLKLENLQETGAFKLRGATNRLLTLMPDERARVHPVDPGGLQRRRERPQAYTIWFRGFLDRFEPEIARFAST